MNLLRRAMLVAAPVPLFVIALGCGAEEAKIVKVEPPPPPTEKEQARSPGMPKGYGQGSAYQKAMERAANRQ
jgi:hypothetical protein